MTHLTIVVLDVARRLRAGAGSRAATDFLVSVKTTPSTQSNYKLMQPLSSLARPKQQYGAVFRAALSQVRELSAPKPVDRGSNISAIALRNMQDQSVALINFNPIDTR